MRLWGIVVAALAVASAACGGGAGDARVAASASSSDAADEVVEDVTTTTVTTGAPPVIETTLPPVTLPGTVSTTVRPRVRTTTTAAAPATAAPKTEFEPGTSGWGYGDLGAHRVVEQGPTKVDFAIYHLHSYDGEGMEAFVAITDEGVVRDVHVDFGDGHSWDANFYYSCYAAANPYPKPNPIHYQTGRYSYAAPGDYKVTVTVKTVRCTDSTADAKEIEPNTVVTSITAHQHAGPRPKP